MLYRLQNLQVFAWTKIECENKESKLNALGLNKRAKSVPMKKKHNWETTNEVYDRGAEQGGHQRGLWKTIKSFG